MGNSWGVHYFMMGKSWGVHNFFMMSKSWGVHHFRGGRTGESRG